MLTAEGDSQKVAMEGTTAMRFRMLIKTHSISDATEWEPEVRQAEAHNSGWNKKDQQHTSVGNSVNGILGCVLDTQPNGFLYAADR